MFDNPEELLNNCEPLKKLVTQTLKEASEEIDKPFYMTSRSGNKVDYNPFGYNEYKQYNIK